MFSDSSLPYSDNTDTEITTPLLDLSTGAGKPSLFEFYSICDTEYDTGALTDYMSLEYSSDGVNFSPAIDPDTGTGLVWDEAILKKKNWDPDSPS